MRWCVLKVYVIYINEGGRQRLGVSIDDKFIEVARGRTARQAFQDVAIILDHYGFLEPGETVGNVMVYGVREDVAAIVAAHLIMLRRTRNYVGWRWMLENALNGSMPELRVALPKLLEVALTLAGMQEDRKGARLKHIDMAAVTIKCFEELVRNYYEFGVAQTGLEEHETAQDGGES